MNVRRIAAVIRKEIHEIARDPVTIWISLLMPLVMLFLFGYAISLDVKDVPFGVWDGDRSPSSRALTDAFTQSGYFSLAWPQALALLGIGIVLFTAAAVAFRR